MTRAMFALFVGLALAGPGVAAPARAPEDLKAQDFLQHCKTDWEFCKVRIQAQMTQLNAIREACIPNDVARDVGAVRVANVLEEALEEDSSLFETGDYKFFIAQIIVLIWPCGAVS